MILRLLIAFFLFLSGTMLSANAPVEEVDLDAIRDELARPVTIRTPAGREFIGFARNVTPTQLVLVNRVDSGEAAMIIEQADIESIFLPGSRHRYLAEDLMQEGRTAEALPILEALYLQRARFFPHLPTDEPLFFVQLASAYLKMDRSFEAIATAEQLTPYLASDYARDLLEDVILESHYRLNNITEARKLARAWIDDRPLYNHNALGFLVLADLAAREENWEESLWTALNPVAFSARVPMEMLDQCYALAITAANRTREFDLARRLLREMQERQLRWPENRPRPDIPEPGEEQLIP